MTNLLAKELSSRVWYQKEKDDCGQEETHRRHHQIIKAMKIDSRSAVEARLIHKQS